MKKWLALVLCVAYHICPVSLSSRRVCKRQQRDNCLKSPNAVIALDDSFGVCTDQDKFNDTCLMILNAEHPNGGCRRMGVKLKRTSDKSLHLFALKPLFEKRTLCVVTGRKCGNVTSSIVKQIQDKDPPGTFQPNKTENCSISCITNQTCESHVDDAGYCERVKDILSFKSHRHYIINVTNPLRNCYKCKNMEMKPEEDIDLDIQLGDEEGLRTDPAKAAEFIKNLNSLVSQMNKSSASISLGATKGVIVKQNEIDLSDIFLYYTLNNTILIASDDDENDLSTVTTSVFISKEAFDVAYKLSNSTPFVGFFQFNNMAKNEENSNVLHNKVLAIDMGTIITNLSDTIRVHFLNVDQEGIPTCRSWDGEGHLPNWTDNGCDTLVKGDSIECQCSHLTFFAVIMSSNTTIPPADLKSLTYITYVGCGLSIFFLSIAFFMHFLTRKTKASESKDILIQLMMALFLLNLSFLTNTWVANFVSTVGCQVMAALMHYSMLATFTWFAMNAFHLCLHFYRVGNIVIHRYILKVSVTAWVTPSLVVIILLILGKYGDIAITTDGNEISMCWITNNELQYIINITYYVLVFLFTFTTFILILSWLCLTKKSRVGYVQMSGRSTDIVSIFGLCCTLGISWGIAFFAHGVLQLPSYYIFTILNSFQGFFLFLYYYKTTKADEIQSSSSSSISSHTTT